MSMLLVYFFVMMDNLAAGFIIFTVASVTGFVISAMARSDYEPGRPAHRKWGKCLLTCGIAMCIFAMLAILTPNTKQFAAIYLIPKMVNNEDVRAMSGDAMKAMRLKFGEWLDNLEPKEVVKEIKEAVDPIKQN